MALMFQLACYPKVSAHWKKYESDFGEFFIIETTVNYTAANGQTVATVDECAGIRFHSGNISGGNNEMATVGMRMMISNNFAPKTRLRMASRLLIMEV